MLATLAAANSDEAEAKLNAFILASYAHHKGWNARDLKTGPQGMYKPPPAGEFFQRLLYKFPDKDFKTWMR
jgi:hypothetical protein